MLPKSVVKKWICNFEALMKVKMQSCIIQCNN